MYTKCNRIDTNTHQRHTNTHTQSRHTHILYTDWLHICCTFHLTHWRPTKLTGCSHFNCNVLLALWTVWIYIKFLLYIYIFMYITLYCWLWTALNHKLSVSSLFIALCDCDCDSLGILRCALSNAYLNVLSARIIKISKKLLRLMNFSIRCLFLRMWRRREQETCKLQAKQEYIYLII